MRLNPKLLISLAIAAGLALALWLIIILFSFMGWGFVYALLLLLLIPICYSAVILWTEEKCYDFSDFWQTLTHSSSEKKSQSDNDNFIKPL